MLRLTGRPAVIGAAVLVAAIGPILAPPHFGATAHPRAAAHNAKTVTIKIGLNGNFTGYKNPRVTFHRGQRLVVVNHDRMAHTVTSRATDKNGNRLFDVTVGAGKKRTIAAAGKLVAGKYKFYCRIHPTMRGVLTVKGHGGTVRAAKQAFNQPLRLPRVIRSSHVQLPIEKRLVRVLPSGPKTAMWTYGGSYPGPIIRRPAGHDTKVTVTDRLPASAGRFTMHFHGDHHRSADDGRPTQDLIARNQPKTYDFPLTDNGKPERAATDFYHDHRMDLTSRNIWRGLQGIFIIDPGKGEKRYNLPSGRYDVPLLVSDRSFNSHNQLTNPFMADGMPKQSGTVGNKVLVDGRYAPYLNVATHRYRLRLINASNFSAYNFALSNGRSFVQVGTGSGLLPRPVTRKSILLGPAQRADVVVDFAGLLHKNVVLKSVPRTGHRPKGSADSPSVPIMQFRVRHRVADGNRVPHILEPPPPIRVTEKKPSFTWRLGGSGRHWTINGHGFDPSAYDVAVGLNSTHLWRIVNNTKMTHFVHLHEEQWETVSRDGHAPPPWERGLEDTWLLDPGESIVVKARFTDYTGPFMIHCHMLDHEDEGMMAQFVVGTPPPGMHKA